MTGSVIEARDLEFGWTPGRPLLRIDHLAVGATERVFVHGPSGSGKSSLLSLLAGVVLPQRGSLRVLGTELPGLAGAARDAFRADHFGIIFQMFNLVPYLSIVENVTLPCRFSERRRRQAKARGGVEAEARRLLDHLDLAATAQLPGAVMRLSVGQQQRVAAARALIGRPEIVLADEPTSALDADRREAFLRLLFRECETERATLLFVSHDRSLECLFDRSLALDDIGYRPAPVNA
ncbi:MAG TPA: ATP-binding cassette domain-containing protein [Methylomirabilota bacterium]|nr:ATP-binding cassette domain-containing protein [Methylomirabilota bacterium]